MSKADEMFKEYIEKNKIRELIEKETVNINGLKLLAIEDLEELLDEKNL